jgi:hypothetical protein
MVSVSLHRFAHACSQERMLSALHGCVVQHSPRMRPDDIRELSRHLSRIVYLLLYVVIGSREVIGILNNLWRGAPVDFNLFDAHFRQGPEHAGFDPKDDFQLFFVSGLFALLFVRVLAFTVWSRSAKRAAAWHRRRSGNPGTNRGVLK